MLQVIRKVNNAPLSGSYYSGGHDHADPTRLVPRPLRLATVALVGRDQWTDATHPGDAPAGQPASQAPQTGSSSQPAGPRSAELRPSGPSDSFGPSAPGGPAGPPPEPREGRGRSGAGRPCRRRRVPAWIGRTGARRPAATRCRCPPPRSGIRRARRHARRARCRGSWAAAEWWILIVVIVVAAMFLINPDSTPTASDSTPPPATTQEPSSEPLPETTIPPSIPDQQNSAPPLPQPRSGRVQDPETGLSYAFPGSPWQVPTSVAPDPLGVDVEHRGRRDLPERLRRQGRQLARQHLHRRASRGVALRRGRQHAGDRGDVAEGHRAGLLQPRAQAEDRPGQGHQGERQGRLAAHVRAGLLQGVRGQGLEVEEGAGRLRDRGPGSLRPSGAGYISVPDNLDMSVADRVVESLKLS